MKMTKEEIFNTNDVMIEKITEKYGENIGKYYKYSNISLRGFVLSMAIGIAFSIISIIIGFTSPFLAAFIGFEIFAVLTLLMMGMSLMGLGVMILSYLMGLIYCLIMAYISYKLEDTTWAAIFILGGLLCITISLICPILILLLVVLDIFYKKQFKEEL
jgi:hypothetical protein